MIRISLKRFTNKMSWLTELFWSFKESQVRAMGFVNNQRDALTVA